jgi:hypothetical protein
MFGHPTAYAATNFPFGVITIYPTFFKYPVDDIERATILLHESYHLFGDDEKFAAAPGMARQGPIGMDVAPLWAHTAVEEHSRMDPCREPTHVHLRGGRPVGLSGVATAECCRASWVDCRSRFVSNAASAAITFARV